MKNKNGYTKKLETVLENSPELRPGQDPLLGRTEAPGVKNIVAEDPSRVENSLPGNGPGKAPRIPATLDFDPDTFKDTLKMIVAMPFDYMAKRKGDHWKLDDQELENISILSSRITSKYAPALLVKFQDEIALAGLVAFTILGRMAQDQAIDSKKAPAPVVKDPPAPAPVVQDPPAPVKDEAINELIDTVKQ